MNKSSKLFSSSKMLADFLLMSLIILIIDGGLVPGKENFYTKENLIVVFFCLTSWLVIGRALGLYGDFTMKPFSEEWVVFIKTLLFYILIICFVFFQFIHGHHISRLYVVLLSTLIFTLLPLQKILLRLSFRKLRNRKKSIRKVLIVGAGTSGVNFFQEYVKNKSYGLQLTGFVDDIRNPSLNGYYLGKTTDIGHVINNYELDDIIVALPSAEEKQIEKVVSIGEKEGKRIRILANYEGFARGRLKVDQLGSSAIITLRPCPLDSIDNRVYKRMFDVLFSLLVIIFLLSWLIPIIALLIKRSSKGPVFFKQERWGLNNKTITCFKFRSMEVSSCDVDENGNYLQAKKNDTRITPIGKFLRKTNLDELPQFFNVLMGSMSVVGPRPHPVPLNIQSKDSVENYMMRHWVKPGISGWAQSNGFRGETRDPMFMRKRVEHDLWYIEHWTFWLDLQIIVQTLVNMVKGEKNAY